MNFDIKVTKTYSTVYTVKASNEEEALLLARELPVDFDNEDYTETEIME